MPDNTAREETACSPPCKSIFFGLRGWNLGGGITKAPRVESQYLNPMVGTPRWIYFWGGVSAAKVAVEALQNIGL